MPKISRRRVLQSLAAKGAVSGVATANVKGNTGENAKENLTDPEEVESIIRNHSSGILNLLNDHGYIPDTSLDAFKTEKLVNNDEYAKEGGTRVTGLKSHDKGFTNSIESALYMENKRIVLIIRPEWSEYFAYIKNSEKGDQEVKLFQSSPNSVTTTSLCRDPWCYNVGNYHNCVSMCEEKDVVCEDSDTCMLGEYVGCCKDDCRTTLPDCSECCSTSGP